MRRPMSHRERLLFTVLVLAGALVVYMALRPIGTRVEANTDRATANLRRYAQLRERTLELERRLDALHPVSSVVTSRTNQGTESALGPPVTSTSVTSPPRTTTTRASTSPDTQLPTPTSITTPGTVVDCVPRCSLARERASCSTSELVCRPLRDVLTHLPTATAQSPQPPWGLYAASVVFLLAATVLLIRHWWALPFWSW